MNVPSERTVRRTVLVLTVLFIIALVVGATLRQSDTRASQRRDAQIIKSLYVTTCQDNNARWAHLVTVLKSFGPPPNETAKQRREAAAFYKAIGPIDCTRPQKEVIP